MRPSQGLEVKVGLLVIVSFIATITMIMLADKISFEHYYRIAVYLDDAGGLRVDSPVTLSGITIGNVVAVEHSEDPRGAIRVVARIKGHEQIPRTARLTLSSSGIFGDSFLAFAATGPSGGGYLSTDGTASMVASQGFLGQATEQAKNILQAVTKLADDATINDVRRLVHNAGDLAGDGAKLAHTLAAQDQHLTQVITNLQSITDNLKIAADTLAKRTDDIASHLDSTLATTQAKVNMMTGDVENTLNKVDDLLGTTQGLLDGHRAELGTLIDSLAHTATHAAGILKAIESGQGVLGRLVYSKDLASNLDAVVIDLTVAAHILEQHPSSVVWGESRAERAEATRQRERLTQEHSFHRDLGDPPPVSAPAAGEAPAALPAH